MASATAEEVIASILEKVGITRVISVDDDYNRGVENVDAGTVYSSFDTLPSAQVAELLEPYGEIYATDDTVFNARFRSFWDNAEPELKAQFHQRVRALLPNSQVEETETDVTSVRELPQLFTTVKIQRLNLHEWRNSAKDIYSSSAQTKTLIMFDQDFKRNGGTKTEGLTLIRETLAVPESPEILCCLVSHLFHEETLHSEWKALCAEQNFPQSKVIVIPKEVLSNKPLTFASLIKLAAVAPSYEEMRGAVLDITRNAIQKADEEMKALDLAELDTMVFRASDGEGVWEPDTLFRIFGIALRSSTREAALGDEKLQRTSAYIRKVSGVATPVGDEAKGGVWKYNRAENFEEGRQLNALHRPTETGDIYEKAGGRRYVLIAPPCDMMVRTRGGYRGSDSDLIREATLAELVTEEPPSGLGWRIDFADQNREVFVNFKKTVTTRLLCLDMCVFNEEGEAVFSLDEAPHPLLIPAWVKRHGVVKGELKKLLDLYARINPDAKQKDAVGRLIARADGDGVFSGSLSPTDRTIKLNFKRVARLLAPRSLALVKAYGEFLNRDAFEHPFGAKKTAMQKTA